MPALAPVLAFAEVVAGRRLAAPGDGHSYYLALRTVVARSWRAGALPSWDPWAFGGSPLLALHQPAVFHPLNLLSIGLPVVAGHHLMLIGSLSLAGTGAYLLSRRLGADPVGGAVAGAGFALCGFMFGHVVHVSIVATAAWLPWVLWGFELVRERLGPGRLLAACGSVTMAVLSGHGQMLAATLAALAIYATVLAVVEWRNAWRPLVLAVLVAGGGLALGAVQLLPVLSIVDETDRAALSYDAATAFSFSPTSTPLLLFPFAYGNHRPSGPFTASYGGEWSLTELSGYVGAGALVLAVAALGRHRLGDRRLWALAAMAGLALAAALGDSTPLGRLVHAVPLFGRFRAWGRYTVVVGLVVAVLAGLGATELRSSDRVRRAAAARRAVVAAGGIVTLAIAVAVLPALSAGRAGTGPGGLGLALPAAAGVVMAIAAVAAARTRRRLPLSVVLVAVVVADLLSFGTFFRWRDHSPTPGDARALLSGRTPPRWGGVPDAPGGVDRSLYAGTDPLRLAPWYQRVPDAQRTRSANGFDPLAPRRYLEAVGAMEETGAVLAPERVWSAASHVLDLLRVSVVVVDTEATAAPPPAGLGRATPVPRSSLVRYERRPALADAFLVGEARVVSADRARQALWGRSPLDPAATALVEGRCPACAALDRPGPAGQVGTRRWGLNSVRVEVAAARPAMLVVSSAWFPGWSAEVDGRPAPVLRVDGVVQGVPVPAGRHDVVLRYRPPGLVAGAATSAATLACFAAWAVTRRYRQASNQIRRSSSAFGPSTAA